MTAWIGLIEDSESRVAWLQDNFPSHRIIHSCRVAKWLDMLRGAITEMGSPSALIFDHDLGIGSFEDVDGANGYDALVRSWDIARAPFNLIWSTNDEAREKMRLWLALRSARVEAIPFDYLRFAEIRSILNNMLEP